MLENAKISLLPKKDKGLKVELNNQEFFVSLNDNNNINNIQYWYTPFESSFKTKEEYIQATSIDAKTYFAVQEIVELFLTLNKEGVGE
jgi:hypothetical protein